MPTTPLLPTSLLPRSWPATRHGPVAGSSRLGVALVLATATTLAAAQPLPPSFVASPDIYKVLAENAQQRVIAVTWKPGQRDKAHSHPASAVYYLTDCVLRIHTPDGTTRDVSPLAGMAIVQPPIPAHELENIGPGDCRLIMFEPAS